MTNTTRRQFIGRTAAGAAGIAVPTIIPSSVLGAASPGNRVAVGLIGMGKMCQGHLGALLGANDVHITGVCDVESIRLDNARKKVDQRYAERYEKGTYTACVAYRDFRELIARQDIDAVLIATPTNWHAVIAVEALRAGKDVYCEKPLALTIREARAVVNAVDRHNRIFQTGTQQRSDYSFRMACEIVRNGRIGQVHTVYVNVGGPSGPCYLGAQPVPESLDWNMWLGPAPERAYHSTICPMDNFKVWPQWRRYWDYGGGGMTDIGAHHFDIAQWGLGKDDTGPVEIAPPDGRDIPRLRYTYADGTVMYHGGGAAGAAVEFIGENGRVLVNRGQFLVTEPEELKRESWGPNDVRLYRSPNHQRNWIDCVKTRRQCICTAEIGCRSVSVCHLGRIAYRLKRPLKWDPVSEQFVGDAEANRHLGRAMRAPWRV